MARASRKLISALRKAARDIKEDNRYQWGHMGMCNCGHVAQHLTDLSGEEIHNYALRGKGDWTEQVDAFCPTSQFPMDLLISELISNGLTLQDLINLERLKDPLVLEAIPESKKSGLRHNSKQDVALYLDTWANQLECDIEARESNVNSYQELTEELKLN